MSQADVLTRNRRLAKRKQPKRGLDVTCQKGSWGLGANLAVRVLDVSEAGIRLLVKSALDYGQECAITLSAPGKGRSLKALGKAVWCVEAADGDYCVGLRFQRRLAYADLLSLTSPTPA